VNAYAYCVGDPVNQVDPTGHVSFTALKATLKFMRPIFKNRTGKQIENSTSSTGITASMANETPAGMPIFQANGAPAGPPPRYTFKASATPFSGKTQRDLYAQPPAYDSLNSDYLFNGEYFTNYPPEFSPDTARLPPASRIQNSINNHTREYQSIIDNIRDTPTTEQHARLEELETFIRERTIGRINSIDLPRYQK
jgi:hypothetical protein